MVRGRRTYDPSKFLNNNNSNTQDSTDNKKEEQIKETVTEEKLQPEIKPKEKKEEIKTPEKRESENIEQDQVVDDVPKQEKVIEQPIKKEEKKTVSEDKPLVQEPVEEKKKVDKKQPIKVDAKPKNETKKEEEKPHYVFGRDEDGKVVRISNVLEEEKKEDLNMPNPDTKLSMLNKMLNEVEQSITRNQLELEIQENITAKSFEPNKLTVSQRKEANMRETLDNLLERKGVIVQLMEKYKDQ